MLQHRFLVLHPVWYHFSTSSLLCKVGTIFDIPTSLFSTNTAKKLETLVQQYFYYCGCGGGKGKCQYAIFYPFAREKLTCELSLQCDTILYNYYRTVLLPPIFPSKQLILSSPPSLPQGMKNSCFLSPTILTTSQCIICLKLRSALILLAI